MGQKGEVSNFEYFVVVVANETIADQKEHKDLFHGSFVFSFVVFWLFSLIFCLV